MIKTGIFESIRRLPAFILLFSGIMACALSPCRVFASGAMNPVVGEAADEIATFDEDEEAAFDRETASDGSPLLHAEHYRQSVYFPERQKRSLISYSWVHILPFAGLVVLALAASRFFARRKNKTILVVNRDEGACE